MRKSLDKPSILDTAIRIALIYVLSGCSGNSESKNEPLPAGAEEDINNIEDSDTLKTLSLSSTEAEDLSKYKGQSFKRVSISYTNINDLEPLRGMPIECIDMAFSMVKDLEPLRGMSIKEIDIRNTNITDLSPLEGAPIELIFLNEKATDLSPIRTAIENGAKVFPPMEYRINRKNWTLEKTGWKAPNTEVDKPEKDDGPPMEVIRGKNNKIERLDFTGDGSNYP